MPLINSYSTVGPPGFDPETGLMTEDNPLSMSARPVTAGLSLTDPTLSVTSPVAPVPPTSTPPQKPGLGAAAWLVPIVTTLFAKKLGISRLAGFSAGAQGVAGAQKSIDKQNSDAVREGLAQKAQDRADAQAKSLADSRKAETINKALDQIEQGGTDSALAFIQVAPGFTDAERKEMADSVSKIAPMKLKVLKDRADQQTKAALEKANETYERGMQEHYGDKYNLNRTYDANGKLNIQLVPKKLEELTPTDQADIRSKVALAGLHEGQAGNLSQMKDSELLIRLENAQKVVGNMFDDDPAKPQAQALVSSLYDEVARRPSLHMKAAGAGGGGGGNAGSGYDPTKTFMPEMLGGNTAPPVTAGLSAGIAPAPAQTQPPVAPPATPPPVVPSATQPALTPLPPDSVARLQTAGIKPDKPQKAPPEQIAGMKFKAAHYEGMSEAKVDALIKTLKANNPLITTDDQALQIILKRLHEKTGK